MNAHINRDLVAALLSTFEKLGGEPARGSARHNDYMRINTVLGEVHAQAKAFLFLGSVARARRAPRRCRRHS